MEQNKCWVGIVASLFMLFRNGFFTNITDLNYYKESFYTIIKQ